MVKRKTCKKTALPDMQRRKPKGPKARKQTGPEVEAVPPLGNPQAQPDPPGIIYATHAAATEKIQSLTPEGEGFLLTVLGIPRMGKTYFTRAVIEARLTAGDFVIVQDPKLPCAYTEGAHTMKDRKDISPEESTVNRAGKEISGEALAQTALELATSGSRTTIVFDEMLRVLGGYQCFERDENKVSHIRLLYSEGGSQGVSVIALSQAPQWLPREVTSFATATVIFRSGGTVLDGIATRYRLTPEQEKTIENLAVGQFIILAGAVQWDRTVYGPE